MRISETKVVQMVEKDEGNSLVIINEEDGSEIEIKTDEIAAFLNSIEYFWPHL